VEKGEKLGQLQFSLFISALQNPNLLSVPAQTIEKNIGQPLQML
jgi:hypothetical protein